MKTHIVVHHSLTKDGTTVSWGAIERFHRDTQGWSDIGYHAGVEQIGPDFYALIGRDEALHAAACREANMNNVGLHVCCVGNYDLAPPPDGLIKALIRRVIVPWMRRYDIPPENVIGHREAGLMAGFDWTKGKYKTCPGGQFDMGLLREMLA